MERKYSQHDLDVAQRLTELETRLEMVSDEISAFRTSNDKRLDELTKLIQDGANPPSEGGGFQVARKTKIGIITSSIVAAVIAIYQAISPDK